MFEGPKLKVGRANHHIKELNSAILDFSKTDFYSIRIKKKAQMSCLVVERNEGSIPDSFALIIGDAVHNLRAALDILICDVVRMSGGVPTQHAKFVLRKSRDELISALNGGILKTSKPSIINLIVDTIKPYNGGNDDLVSLHDLDIQDKHLLITPVVSFSCLYGVSAVDASNRKVIDNCHFIVEGSGEFHAIGAGTPLKITDYGQASFDVLFDKGPFKDRSVIPTLSDLSQLVTDIIEAFEKEF